MSSSARHSEMDLMLRKEASRAPVVSRKIAYTLVRQNIKEKNETWLTRRRGETSTAWRRTVPARPMRVESSRGPALMMALTSTCRGFYSGLKKR
jgi:hypothetical protein